jgi:hypothetical protein
MTHRTVEDRLREEYFILLPEIKRAVHQLHTEVAHKLLGATLNLKHHERIIIEARAKECESAIGALRRREEAREFDEEVPDKYTLTRLPDLAAVRVLVFPRPLLEQVHTTLQSTYSGWAPDHVQTGTPPRLRAWKYYGRCSTCPTIQAELQVVSTLTGLFWHVEHDAFYKPLDPTLRGAVNKPTVREKAEAVYEAFEALEETLERELRNAAQDTG